MNLVDEAKVWWKLHSIQALFVLGSLAEWWLNSTDLQHLLPPRLAAFLLPIAIVIISLLRLRKQLLRMPPPRKVTVPGDMPKEAPHHE